LKTVEVVDTKVRKMEVLNTGNGKSTIEKRQEESSRKCTWKHKEVSPCSRYNGRHQMRMSAGEHVEKRGPYAPLVGR
jgi:hypothetical protein